MTPVLQTNTWARLGVVPFTAQPDLFIGRFTAPAVRSEPHLR